MKYFFFGLFTFTLLLSCSNEFDITEEFKDIPVVYGFLNPIDTATYIRVERAFIDESISALEIAQRPDSLYYSNANVSLVICQDASCQNFGQEFPLTQVDGNLEGYIRDEGVFAQAPNLLYKIKPSELLIEAGKTYQIRIDRGIESLDIVTAQTTVVDNPVIQSPSAIGLLSFKSGSPTMFSWKYVTNNDPTPASIFEVRLLIKYQESLNNGVFESKVLEWVYSTNNSSNETERMGDEFYIYLASNLENNPNIKRIFNKIDFVLDAGGPELLEFINIGLANLGITSTQDVPVFSNISEGVGLFSSKNQKQIKGIGVNQNTLDSLKLGQYTKDLNFQ